MQTIVGVGWQVVQVLAQVAISILLVTVIIGVIRSFVEDE